MMCTWSHRAGHILYSPEIVNLCVDSYDRERQQGKLYHLYTADGFEGELKECEEGHLEWVPKEDLEQLELWEGDKIFFRLLAQEAPFFSLKLVYEKGVLMEAVLDGRSL